VRVQPRRGRVRACAFGLVPVALIVAVAWRATSEPVPVVQVHRTLAAYVRLPGGPPALAWPGEGQAAVDVQDITGATASAGASTPAPIASVAKVMTAYLTLLAHPLDPGQQGFALTITPADVAEERERVALDQSVVPVRAGEHITERQALEALLLPSANNIAALLARHAGGGTAFVARMNATARRLGMSSTRYTDPSGFTATTVSTATDQLKLAHAAMSLPAFAEIVAERSVALPVAGRVGNYNTLIGSGGYVGIKTGSDDAAGGCLMFAKRAVVAGRAVTVLGVVLGQRGGALVAAALLSAQRLGDSVVAALRVQTALPAGTRVLALSAADGRRTVAASTGALRALGWGGMKLAVEVSIAKSGRHVSAGERLATVSLDSTGAVATSAVAVHALAGPSLGWRLSHLL